MGPSMHARVNLQAYPNVPKGEAETGRREGRREKQKETERERERDEDREKAIYYLFDWLFRRLRAVSSRAAAFSACLSHCNHA